MSMVKLCLQGLVYIIVSSLLLSCEDSSDEVNDPSNMMSAGSDNGGTANAGDIVAWQV